MRSMGGGRGGREYVHQPGVGLLVFLRNEEPDEVGVTQPPLFVHLPVSDGANLTVTTEMCIFVN